MAWIKCYCGAPELPCPPTGSKIVCKCGIEYKASVNKAALQKTVREQNLRIQELEMSLASFGSALLRGQSR